MNSCAEHAVAKHGLLMVFCWKGHESIAMNMSNEQIKKDTEARVAHEGLEKMTSTQNAMDS